MTGIGRLDLVVFDAPDVDALATFYTALLPGWTVAEKTTDWIALKTPAGPGVAFQSVADYRAPVWPGQERPQQVHLDVDVGDFHAHAERAVALGATKLNEGPYWVTLADPAGHPFDLCRAAERNAHSPLWVSLDAPDPSALARFYASLLGMPIVHDNEVGAAISADDRTLFFQPAPGYTAPRWPDPAYPQQAHLHIRLDAPDDGRAEALGAVATDVPGVYIDPAGHPFCLISN